jgi:uncharacterized membrane protein
MRMLVLILGLTLFFGPHFYSAFRSRDGHNPLLIRTGRAGYRGGFSLIVALGLAGILYGFGAARMAPPIYTSPSWARDCATLLMLPALALVAAAYLPMGHLKQKLRHPMLVGVGIWACAHLLTGANLPRLLLFGSFLVFSAVDFVAASKRNRGERVEHPLPSLRHDVYALAIGAAAYVAVLFWLHGTLIGIDLHPG